MITLLRHRQIGEPSCSRLVRALRLLGHDPLKVDRYDPETCSDTEILIRWGHVGRFPLRAGALEVNSPASIRLGLDKAGTRRTLQEAHVATPQTYFTLAEALAAGVYPLIGRPSTHTQGQDVEVIMNRAQLVNSRSAYWSHLIAKDREFRVYVFGGRALGVVEKVPENRGDIAWNAHRGATLTDLRAGQYPETIIPQAILAARAVGQHFSGVDIMTRGSVPYVLELNSSLALSNAHRVDLFARAFAGLFESHLAVRA